MFLIALYFFSKITKSTVDMRPVRILKVDVGSVVSSWFGRVGLDVIRTHRMIHSTDSFDQRSEFYHYEKYRDYVEQSDEFHTGKLRIPLIVNTDGFSIPCIE